MCQFSISQNFAYGEDSLALRLESKLSDLRAANANWSPRFARTPVLSCGASKKGHPVGCPFLEAPPRIELGIRALQAPALPLGHGAI